MPPPMPAGFNRDLGAANAANGNYKHGAPYNNSMAIGAEAEESIGFHLCGGSGVRVIYNVAIGAVVLESIRFQAKDIGRGRL